MSGDKAEGEIARALRRLIEDYGLTIREKGAADLALALALDASAAPYAYTDGATATALSIKALRDMRDAFAPLPPTPREMLRFVEVFGTPPIIGIDIARQEASWSSEYMGTFAPAGSRRETIYSGATKRADLEAMERAAMPKVARPAPPPPANRARYAARLANVEAHGPAWSEGTPHTDEEASVMCGAVEPDHAREERARERAARVRGDVRVSMHREPNGMPWWRVIDLADWRALWRSEPVPPLCALRERCEASGAVIVVGVATRYTTWAERYGALSPVRERLEINNPLGRQPLGGDPLGPEGGERQPRRDHAGPYDEPRGWCAGLAGD